MRSLINPSHKGPTGDRERGAAAIALALATVVLAIAGALVVDLGHAFTTRREMQNAADAGALAGANVLAKSLWYDGKPVDMAVASSLDSVVRTAVENNGGLISGSDSSFHCHVLARTGPGTYTELAHCDQVGAWANRALQPAGVQVVANHVDSTLLAGVPPVDLDELDIQADAAAAAQPLAAGNGAFLVCADQTTSGGIPNTRTLLVGGRSAAPPYDVNLDAIGQAYNIFGPQVDLCGSTNGSFKGRQAGNPDDPFTVFLPADLPYDNGVAAGQVEITPVAGQAGCEDSTDLWRKNCVIFAPICVSASTADNTMDCVKLGAFRIIPQGDNTPYPPDNKKHPSKSNEWNAVFLGAAVAVGGAGGSGELAQGAPLVVKLIDSPPIT